MRITKQDLIGIVLMEIGDIVRIRAGGESPDVLRVDRNRGGRADESRK